jgi:protein-S-isoprenylcysteine O-methyltransferase
MPSGRLLLAGGVLHLALLLAPLLGLGRAGLALRQPRVVLFLALAAALCSGELAAHSRPSDEQGGEPLALFSGLSLLGLFWAALLEASLRPQPAGLGSAAAGSGLLAAGILLRCAAIRTLGRHFVSRPQVLPGQSLVRSGPYRLVRHPSETGLLAIGLGAGLLLESGAALLLWAAALLPSSLLRVGREERLLDRAFGEEHRRYRARVPALLPAARAGPEPRIALR